MADLAEIWVPEPQINSMNNGINFTRGHMGQIPVIRCFIQKIIIFLSHFFQGIDRWNLFLKAFQTHLDLRKTKKPLF